jgi:DNA primase
MTLLELVQDFGLDLKKTSNCKGGEYHSACPACGEGVNRFAVWPQRNRYWCRRCGTSGDTIQFCRDFMKLSYHEACKKVGESPRLFNHREYKYPISEKPNIFSEPPKEWQGKALAFIEWGQKQLRSSRMILEDLHQRGFTESSINDFKLGCSINSSGRDFYRERSEWGLSCEYKDDGKTRKLWLPAGLIIPTISDKGSVCKLKVRRHKWHPEDKLPKYVEISGSNSCPSVYGDIGQGVVIVLESELDAMLIQQNANDLCFCVALGGVTKRPDFCCDQLLRKSKLILWCLDNDEAGENAAFWWRKTYQHLKFWPSPFGKSPGDALKDYGIDLRQWILKGIGHYTNSELMDSNE